MESSCDQQDVTLGDLPFKPDLSDVEFTPAQEQQVKSLFHKYQDCFCQSDDDLGFTETLQHTIPTADEVPVKVPHRRDPPHQIQEVRDHIDKLLRQNVIQKSTRLYAAPVILDGKKDRSLRLCDDYIGY